MKQVEDCYRFFADEALIMEVASSCVDFDIIPTTPAHPIGMFIDAEKQRRLSMKPAWQ
jgi:hypothetical protein